MKLLTTLFFALTLTTAVFADYKKDFSYNIDAEKIEKGLAEATTAKDVRFIDLYGLLKALINKDTSNTTYNDLKQIVKKYNQNGNLSFPQIILFKKQFKNYIPNVIDDMKNLSLAEAKYIKKYYSGRTDVFSKIGFNKWHATFINLDTIKNIERYEVAKGMVTIYGKEAINLSNDQVKADTQMFKRVWYRKISESNEWKQLLVEIELIKRSIE